MTWVLLLASFLSCSQRDGYEKGKRNFEKIESEEDLIDCMTLSNGALFEFKEINSERLTEVLLQQNQLIFGEKAAEEAIEQQIQDYLAEHFSGEMKGSQSDLTRGTEPGDIRRKPFPMSKYQTKHLRIETNDFRLSYGFKICLEEYLAYQPIDTVFPGDAPWTKHGKHIYAGKMVIDIELVEKHALNLRTETEFYRKTIRDTIELFVGK